MSVRDALRDRGTDAKNVIDKELSQMITKRVWTPVHVSDLSQADRSRIIRSSMFIKEKFTAGGEFEKLKARLVAGGVAHIPDSVYRIPEPDKEYRISDTG